LSAPAPTNRPAAPGSEAFKRTVGDENQEAGSFFKIDRIPARRCAERNLFSLSARATKKDSFDLFKIDIFLCALDFCPVLAKLARVCLAGQAKETNRHLI